MIKTAALIPNLAKSGTLRCAMRAAAILQSYGIKVVTDENTADSFAALGGAAAVKVERLGFARNIYASCDAAVVFGGDGTVISSAKRAAEAGVPIIGVNFGKVGYITELEEHETELLARLSTGEYSVEERMMLDVCVNRNGRRIFFARAFNEAAITRGSTARLADFIVCCGDRLAAKYRADGLIIATPTGSTAYSMAAGGPVIDPSVDVLCLTPVCSHSLKSARPLIFGPESELKITVPSARNAESVITVDGFSSFRLSYTDAVISVTRAQQKVKLIRLKPFSFCDTLYKKFGAE